MSNIVRWLTTGLRGWLDNSLWLTNGLNLIMSAVYMYSGALRLVLIGKHAHIKGNIRHARTKSQGISSNSNCLFR